MSKKFFMAFVVAGCILAVAVPAQSATTDRRQPAPEVKEANDGFPGPATRDTGGPDAYGYVWIDSAEPGGPTFSWVDISSTGTAVMLGDDDTDGPFSIGFSFDFYGTAFSDFYVSSNGWMGFDAPSDPELGNECPIPSGVSPFNAIGLMWDDLDPGDNSDPIYYETFAAGSCPWGGYAGMCTVIQYEDFCHWPGGSTCTTAGTFEAILFDNNEIVIQFEDAGVEAGSGSTTGIQNGDATIGLTYGCDGSYLSDGSAVLFAQPAQGDLEITKTADDGFAESGPFDFTFMVVNNGPEAQTNVTVVDSLPAALTYVSDTCGGSMVGSDWTWNIGTMNDGAMETCDLTVQFTGGACVAATNTATVSGDVFDPPGNSTSTASNTIDPMMDPGFEEGTPNSYWAEASTNFGTPLCDLASCGTGTGTGPYAGDWWCWFGGVAASETGSVTQTVFIPSTATDMSFWFEAIICDSPADFMQVTIDGTEVYRVDGNSSLCGNLGYTQQLVDISAFADDSDHVLQFYSESYGANGSGSNFFVDDVFVADAFADCTTVQQPTEAIPTLGNFGITLLIGLMVGAGIVVLRRLV